jgi:thiol-disulfide isomerase/thioredoxin
MVELMKKVLFAFCIMVFLFVSLFVIKLQAREVTEDSIKFKNEYENLNSTIDKDGKIIYPQVALQADNKMYYASFEEIMNLLDKDTGVIYFGRPNCPWSRNAVPILLEAADESNIGKIYYFNAESIRDIKHLNDNGDIVIDKKGTSDYYTLVDKLSSILKPYEGLNDDSIKRLTFPTVVFIKDGNIVAHHMGALESQANPKEPLSVKQQNELKEIYINDMNLILGNTCSTSDNNCKEKK